MMPRRGEYGLVSTATNDKYPTDAATVLCLFHLVVDARIVILLTRLSDLLGEFAGGHTCGVRLWSDWSCEVMSLASS